MGLSVGGGGRNTAKYGIVHRFSKEFGHPDMI